MSAQTWTQTQRLALPLIRPQRRPFLDALQHIDFGSLSLVTPEGNMLEFDGPQKGPKAHLRIADWGVFDDLIARGEVGFAEAYIDGRCDSKDLPALLTFALVNSPSLEHFFHGKPLYALWLRLRNAFQGNSLRGSRRNIMAHYDLGNDFYALWLDKSMTYSSAIFAGDVNRTLEEAQQAKYQRILGKLSVKPGDRILEIGCGWGGFAEAAARQGLRVTAVTLSGKQAEYAQERIKRARFDDKVSIVFCDYREMEGEFDHIVSIGMFEHVGEKYWAAYFNAIKKHLKKNGRAMVQSITLDDALFEELHGVSGFIEQYIFPGGMLPSKLRFRSHAAAAGLACQEMYGFGQDYATTLRHWLSRFESHIDQVKALGYDDKFQRLWRFYLASCIGSFDSRRRDVMQAELTHA